MQQWKINCFDGEHVGVITSHMDLTEGDYLQVQDDQYSGKMPHPIGSIIRKNSVGVIFSGQNGNSTGFQSSFLCVGECDIDVSMTSCSSVMCMCLQSSIRERGQSLFFTTRRSWKLLRLVTAY